MQERGIEIKVGILVLVALGIMTAFIIVMGNFSLAEGFAFYVDFDFSGNLQKGAPVKVAGIKVGKIQAVQYMGGKVDPTTKKRVYVRVTAWVEQRVQGTIYEDAEFFVNTQGVLGEQYLEIVPGTAARKPIRAGTVHRGVNPPRMDLVVARLYEVLDGVTRLLREDKETIRNLLKSGTKALRTVDALLSENRPEIKKLLVSLEGFTREGSSLITTVREGLGPPAKIRSLVANLEKTSGSVSRDIDGLLAKTNKALDGVNRVSAMVGPGEEKKIRATLDKLVKLTDRVYTLTGDAQVMVARLNKGKGTVGAILVKDELYHDIKEMVRDLKRNPWKFLWRE